MKELLSSDDFMVFFIAVITTGIGNFVKYATRHDTHKTFSRNDFAIGTDLIVSAVIILATRSATPPMLLLAVFLILWLTSTVIKKSGWESDGQLKIGMGVVLPDVIGIIVLTGIVFYS